jgi:preprotein translocase subunit YajC
MSTMQQFVFDVYPFVVVFIIVGLFMTYREIRKNRKEINQQKEDQNEELIQ